jgi:hypothetical protein
MKASHAVVNADFCKLRISMGAVRQMTGNQTGQNEIIITIKNTRSTVLYLIHCTPTQLSLRLTVARNVFHSLAPSQEKISISSSRTVNVDKIERHIKRTLARKHNCV